MCSLYVLKTGGVWTFLPRAHLVPFRGKELRHLQINWFIRLWQAKIWFALYFDYCKITRIIILLRKFDKVLWLEVGRSKRLQFCMFDWSFKILVVLMSFTSNQPIPHSAYTSTSKMLNKWLLLLFEECEQ